MERALFSEKQEPEKRTLMRLCCKQSNGTNTYWNMRQFTPPDSRPEPAAFFISAEFLSPRIFILLISVLREWDLIRAEVFIRVYSPFYV